MGKSGDFFVTIRGEGLLEKIVPEVNVAWRFETCQDGLSAHIPAQTDEAAARVALLLLAEGDVLASDGADKALEPLEVQSQSGAVEKFIFPAREHLLERGAS